MRSTLMALYISLMMVGGAMAQPTKPLGVWDLGEQCQGVKTWMRASTLQPWSDFTEARKCSERTGMKWIMQFGFNAPLGTPVDGEIAFVQDKLKTSGLAPHVIAMTFVEEWQGLMGKRTIEERNQVWEFGSEQQRKLKQAFPGWLMAYVDQLVNDNPAYGVDLYMPLPRGTDIFLMELYDGDRSMLNLYFDYVKATTNIPIAIIGQGFYDHRFPQYPRPSEDYVEWWRKKLDDPRVVAGMIFTWRNRAPGTIVGLQSMPSVERWFTR